MNLFQLAETLDKTAPSEAAVRGVILEQLAPFFGEDVEDFTGWQEGLLAAGEPCPATAALQRMGFVAVPAGEASGTLLTGRGPGARLDIEVFSERPGVRLLRLYGGSANLLRPDQAAGLDLPCRISGGDSLAVALSYTFSAAEAGAVRFRLVPRQNPNEALLGLAMLFDETPPEPVEPRVALAAEMTALLGPRAAEFDERFEAQGCCSAVAVLCEMGLVHLPREHVVTLLQEAAAHVMRAPGPPDWVDLLRRLQRDMLLALQPALDAPEGRRPAPRPAAAPAASESAPPAAQAKPAGVPPDEAIIASFDELIAEDLAAVRGAHPGVPDGP